jgi:adenylate cyclase
MTAKASRLVRPLVRSLRFPADSRIDVLMKLVLLLGNLGGFFFSFVLMLLYIYFDLPTSTIFAAVYLFAVSLVYVYYFRTRQLVRTAFLFSLLLFLELVCQHIALGGFKSSGLIFIWATASAIMAIITGQSRQAAIWIFLFLATTGIFIYFEPSIAAANSLVPKELSNLLFAMNFGFGLTYMVSNSFYFMYLLGIAREQADDLLLNILPADVARRLKDGETTIADSYNSASIMFVDIVNFTPISAASNAKDMVLFLSKLFSAFDQLVETYSAEKIETIGDSYMVAVGLPVSRSDHAEVIASLALDIQAYLSSGLSINGQEVNCRIGINSGPLMAGVIGEKRISYNVWGDTVNTASRMESHGIPGEIQISETTYKLVKNKFICEPRGEIDVKGKGSMKTYLLKSRASKPSNSDFVE